MCQRKIIREYGSLNYSNSSKVSSFTSQYANEFNSILHQQIPQNKFRLTYPLQPHAPSNYTINGLEQDFKEPSIDSVSSRGIKKNLAKRIFITEKINLTSPSQANKKKQQRINELVQKFIQKISINNNKFINNIFVVTLVQGFQLAIDEFNKSFIKNSKANISSFICYHEIFLQYWNSLIQILYFMILIFQSMILIYPKNLVFQKFTLFHIIIISIHIIFNIKATNFNKVEDINSIKKIKIKFIQKFAIKELIIIFSSIIILLFYETITNFTIIAIIILNITILSQFKFSSISSKYWPFNILSLFLLVIIHSHNFSIINISLIHNNFYNYHLDNQIVIYLQFFHTLINNFLQIACNIEYETGFQILLALVIQILFTQIKINLFFELMFQYHQNKDSFSIKKNYLNLKTFFSNLKIEKKFMLSALKNYKRELKSKNESEKFLLITQFIKNLNFSEQNQITRKVQANYFQKISILQQFSQNTQNYLIDSMELINYQSNQSIITQNCNDDHSIFIVRKGQVQIGFYQNNEAFISVKQLDDSQYFGEISFFTGRPRTSSVISLGPVQVYKISRQLFLNALQNNRIDQELASNIRDQIIFKDFVGITGLSCFCCQSQKHLISSCDKLHYNPNIEKVISKSQFHHVQNRKKINRKKERSKNSVFSATQAKMVCEEFQQNNNYDDHSEILNDLTQQQQPQSFTNIYQQNSSQALSFFHKSENRKAQEKKSIQLTTELDDQKETESINNREKQQFFTSDKNFPLVIQEIEDEDISSPSPKQMKTQYSINKQTQDLVSKRNLNLLQEGKDNVSEICLINNNLFNSSSNFDERSIQQRKSFNFVPYNNSVINDAQAKIENEKLYNQLCIHNKYFQEGREKTNDTYSLQFCQKHQKNISTKIKRLEENSNQFVALSSSKYLKNQNYLEFEKAQNYLYYFPHQNPKFVIHSYNSQIFKSDPKYKRKLKYTVNLALNEIIQQKFLLN